MSADRGRDRERAPLAVYEDYARRGVLAFQVDAHGAPVFPPRAVAPLGFTDPLSWRESAGGGTIHAFTVLYDEPSARVLALIDVDEGFRMLSALVDAPFDTVRVADRVRLRFEPGDPPVAVFAVDREPVS